MRVSITNDFNKEKFMENIITSGDESWEEVVDFTKIQKGGVDINEILKRL